jgi:hypothetical protein
MVLVEADTLTKSPLPASKRTVRKPIAILRSSTETPSRNTRVRTV